MAKVIVVGSQHISKPNLPPYSQHKIISTKKFPLGRWPLEKIWSPLEALAAWQPVGEDYQLVHSFNAIPYTNKPFFVTFELFLPYILSGTGDSQWKSVLKEKLTERLALDNCRKIIPMSEWAKMRFINHLKEWNKIEQVKDKLEVIHPNFPLIASQPKIYSDNQPLQLIFVGAHLARKGGIIALRVASKAKQRKLPITVHIISQLKCGGAVPTDFPDRAKYAPDLKLLELDNVVYHGRVSNQEVLQLLAQSHFQIITTLHDTYGFSVIEGLSVGTPAIATNVCALPEFVRDGDNGYVIPLELDKYKQWKNWVDKSRIATDEYWQTLDSTYDFLAEQTLQRLEEFMTRGDKREHYEHLSAGAIAQVKNVHEAKKANELFDRLYSDAIEQTT